MLDLLILTIFPLFMVVAAATDLLTMRISNKLVLLLAACFIVLAIWVRLPLEQAGMHLLCGLVVLAVAFGLFALRWIGGGDAKLAAATALWFGLAETGTYLIYTAIFGGILTLAILTMRRLPLEAVYVGHPSLDWLARLHDKKQGVPYGVAMAVAGLVTYPSTVIFERLAG